MKYSPGHYAEALYEALDGKSDKAFDVAIKNFSRLLKKNKDHKLLNAILVRYEKIYLKKRGLKKVVVESVTQLTAHQEKEIKTAAGGEILLSAKINPELIAGIKILINDSVLIDASAHRKLEHFFSHS